MKIDEIKWNRLLKKVSEDCLKKSFEFSILAFMLGIPFLSAVPTLLAVAGGSLYRKGNKIDFF